jgi:hypothetical protein
MQNKSRWYETPPTYSLVNLGQRSNGPQPAAMNPTLYADEGETEQLFCIQLPNALMNLDSTVLFMYHILSNLHYPNKHQILPSHLLPKSAIRAQHPNQNPAQESVHQDCNNDQLPISTSKVPNRASIHVENHSSSHENRRL